MGPPGKNKSLLLNVLASWILYLRMMKRYSFCIWVAVNFFAAATILYIVAAVHFQSKPNRGTSQSHATNSHLSHSLCTFSHYPDFPRKASGKDEKHNIL